MTAAGRADAVCEVRVKSATGFPEGSILSIRAGQLRRQGPINCDKAMSFGTGVIDANPFKAGSAMPRLAPTADGRADGRAAGRAVGRLVGRRSC